MSLIFFIGFQCWIFQKPDIKKMFNPNLLIQINQKMLKEKNQQYSLDSMDIKDNNFKQIVESCKENNNINSQSKGDNSKNRNLNKAKNIRKGDNKDLLVFIPESHTKNDGYAAGKNVECNF